MRRERVVAWQAPLYRMPMRGPVATNDAGLVSSESLKCDRSTARPARMPEIEILGRDNQMNAQEEFWNWFVQHQVELLDFNDADQETVFDQVAAELLKINPDLSFEFGPWGKAKREFVISASGIRSAFPAVIALADAAPTLDRWQVTAFRPRRSPVNAVEFGGKRVDPRDVQFTLLDNGKTAAIYLFIPDFQEDDVSLTMIGYLMLDETLGEYDVVCRLAFVEMFSPHKSTDGDRYTLAKLPALFDQLVSRLEGRSGQPS